MNSLFTHHWTWLDYTSSERLEILFENLLFRHKLTLFLYVVPEFAVLSCPNKQSSHHSLILHESWLVIPAHWFMRVKAPDGRFVSHGEADSSHLTGIWLGDYVTLSFTMQRVMSERGSKIECFYSKYACFISAGTLFMSGWKINWLIDCLHNDTNNSSTFKTILSRLPIESPLNRHRIEIFFRVENCTTPEDVSSCTCHHLFSLWFSGTFLFFSSSDIH